MVRQLARYESGRRVFPSRLTRGVFDDFSFFYVSRFAAVLPLRSALSALSALSAPQLHSTTHYSPFTYYWLENGPKMIYMNVNVNEMIEIFKSLLAFQSL